VRRRSQHVTSAGRRSTARWLALVVFLATVAVSSAGSSIAEAAPRIVPVRVIGGLKQAVAFTFSADGRIWFVEKAEANVRVYDPTTGAVDRFVHVPDVVADAEQGLVGIELDPFYPERPFVYLFATRMVEGSLRDQVLRVPDVDGRGGAVTVVWESAASPQHQHSGGRLLFGPDSALYVTVGDALDPEAAQDPASERGKILRMTSEGAPAPGNPDADSLVYASGIRNSFGLAFDPVTGSLWETENGPTCNDEINRIEPGANYGWGPNEECPEATDPGSTSVDGPNPVPPQLVFTPTIAPTGVAFCDECGLGRRYEGAMFFGDYVNGNIHRVTLDDARERVVGTEVVAAAPDLALSVEVGPEGVLYFSSYIAIFRLELLGGRVSPSPPSQPSSTTEPTRSVAASPTPPPRAEGGWGSLALGAIAAIAATGLAVVALAVTRRRRRTGSGGPTGP
jgi:glucose/arabinose dehydrogenase